MKIKLLNRDYLKEIKHLYNLVKMKTYTPWEKGYPSEELICWDIERNGLWGVFDDDKLIAVSFAGQRVEDGEENFHWKQSFKKRGTFARIAVDPDYQNKGIGTLLVKFILQELKNQGFDGVRILVGVDNVNAVKLYSKFGFENCGETERFGHSHYLLEKALD